MTQSLSTAVASMAAALLVAASPIAAQVIPAPTKAEVDKLVAVLQSEASQHEKADACRQLAVIGTPEAVAPLALMIVDEKLSHMVRYALEPLPDPAVDRALREALGRLTGRPLMGVIASIGVRRDAASVGALAPLLTHDNADVARTTARALGDIGTIDAARALQGALARVPPMIQLACCEGLLRCAESLAAHDSRADAIALYDHLRAIEGPHHISTAGWRGAILSRPPGEGLGLLRGRLASAEWSAFATAVRISFEMQGPEVGQALCAELGGSTGPDRQVLILQALGARGDAATLGPIERLAHQGEGPVRLAAVKALGRIGAPAATPYLFELATGDDTSLGDAARAVLLGMVSTEVDAAIRQRLETGDAKSRRLAIELVGQRRLAGASAALRKAADDPDKELRKAAIQAMIEAATAADVADITAFLLTRKEASDLAGVETALGAACGRAKDKAACADILLAALPKAPVAPRCALLRAVRSAGGPKALDAVRGALKDADPTIRDAAFRSLCEWPTVEAAPDLLAAARDKSDPKRRIMATRGYIELVKAEGLAPERRLAMCREAAGLVERIDEQRLLLGALGSVAAPEAMALVLPHLGRKETCIEAAEAAIAVGTQIVDQSPAVVLAAMDAVSKATDNKGIVRRVGPLTENARAKAGAKP